MFHQETQVVTRNTSIMQRQNSIAAYVFIFLMHLLNIIIHKEASQQNCTRKTSGHKLSMETVF